MTKTPITDVPATNTESTAPADGAILDSTVGPSFWLLKDGSAPKLGARAEGGIRFQVLADAERQHLFVAISGNPSGGYFSRERVPFDKIEACLDMLPSGKPFPSKTFKETFVGRSSNNAGFMVAALRSEGLLAAAPEAEAQHVKSGDWVAWKKSMFAVTGTLIAPTVVEGGEKQAGSKSEADPKELKKTLTLPRKKSP